MIDTGRECPCHLHLSETHQQQLVAQACTRRDGTQLMEVTEDRQSGEQERVSLNDGGGLLLDKRNIGRFVDRGRT